MNDEYFGRSEESAAETEDANTMLADTPPMFDGTASLTLADIERETGISYVTLIRYSQQYRDRLPSEGEGNRRRYYPAAITEFEKIRDEIAARRKPRPEKAASSETPRAIQGRKKRKPSKRKPSKPNVPTAARRKKPKPIAPATTATAPPSPLSKLATEALSPIAPDLDRMARVYQLKIQRKALDGVLSFVTEWWTRINAEIEELER